MNLSICTITFRHHLISILELATWAKANGFQAIELWGPHAQRFSDRTDLNGEWLKDLGLSVSMLSDYLTLSGDPDVLRTKTIELCRLAQRWQTGKLRTFAGNRANAHVSAEDRLAISVRLRQTCAIAADHGIRLLVETHPNTLADTVASTARLIDDVRSPNMRINFDALHVWEGGDDPVEGLRILKPFVDHYHLNNVRSRKHLSVFAPDNVYAANGDRTGMTPLFEGTLDYMPLINVLAHEPDIDASLEWFGGDRFEVLRKDGQLLRSLIETKIEHPYATTARKVASA